MSRRQYGVVYSLLAIDSGTSFSLSSLGFSISLMRDQVKLISKFSWGCDYNFEYVIYIPGKLSVKIECIAKDISEAIFTK